VTPTTAAGGIGARRPGCGHDGNDAQRTGADPQTARAVVLGLVSAPLAMAAALVPGSLVAPT
jgi:hypothetical protein